MHSLHDCMTPFKSTNILRFAKGNAGTSASGEVEEEEERSVVSQNGDGKSEGAVRVNRTLNGSRRDNRQATIATIHADMIV